VTNKYAVKREFKCTLINEWDLGIDCIGPLARGEGPRECDCNKHKPDRTAVNAVAQAIRKLRFPCEDILKLRLVNVLQRKTSVWTGRKERTRMGIPVGVARPLEPDRRCEGMVGWLVGS
jgi:hypothetical protein